MSIQFDQHYSELKSCETMFEGSHISSLVKWLNDMLPHLSLPAESSNKELRACLRDGTVLCSILNKLCPGLVEVKGSLQPGITNVESFLAVLNELGLPSFERSDLEQGSMEPVLQCLSTLRSSFDLNIGERGSQNHSKNGWDLTKVDSFEGPDDPEGNILTHGLHSSENGEEARRNLFESRFQDSQSIPVMSEPSTAQPGHEFHEGCQIEQGCLSEDTIVKLMKSKTLSNASFQSLFSIVNGILNDSIERKNGDVSHRVAYLLRKVMQVIEQRISTEAENLKNQNSFYHTREEKYKSKIRVLETLAVGATKENEVVMNQLQQIKIEKFEMEEKKKHTEQDFVTVKKQKDLSDSKILSLKEDLEKTKKAHENYCMQLEADANAKKVSLENKLNELGSLLNESRLKVKEFETFSESKASRWKKRECIYQSFIESQFGALQNLRVVLKSTKHEVLKMKRRYSEELNYVGLKLRALIDAAEKYHATRIENRRLYNEVQDLKGNIRVHCRIRPFFSGENKKQTTIEYIGDNGEIVITNPLKPGKDSRRLFKFNKVFGPTSSQEEIFIETQPLIRSVLDGYNVCIFAYGQTGSGKTYTMSGPSIASKEDWGVNNRALNDLFEISMSRTNSILYEVGVQMIEIYNEQVRDLLSIDGPSKRLGIWNTSQPNGLAVPDACMYPVKSTADVLELMDIGMTNRAVGATALNERSSRSHSVLTVHVRGVDLETDAVLRGNLHLVDLAGSERVDRSEATGDRLKEAQHINKSLSALGDVVFALAQKNQHVPYRNSKLTQVLQSSLGGQAKTLMFVQLNPDVESYSETISTLKFAERVSGVELGAARSNKEGRYVRELMEQVAALKDTLANKDAEIERLQQLKANVNGPKPGLSSLRYGSSSPRRQSTGTPRRSESLAGRKASASDFDNCSEFSDKNSECGSHHSMDDFGRHKNFSSQLNQGGDVGQNPNEDVELLGFGEDDSEERLSDISDGGLSMGTETDGSMCSIVEYTLFPEVSKSSKNKEVDVRQDGEASMSEAQTNNNGVENITTPANKFFPERSRVPSLLSKPPNKSLQKKLPQGSSNRSSSKVSSSVRKTIMGSSSSSSKTPKPAAVNRKTG